VSLRFDWKEFLNLAERLLPVSAPTGQPSQEMECKFRVTISRAYYAAYNIADDYARDSLHYVPTREGSDHKALADHYAYLWQETKRDVFDDIANDLNEMRDKRKSADYFAGHRIGYADASYCVETAQYLISDIDKLKTGQL